MKKRFPLLGFITLSLILVLAGCSPSTQEDLSDVSPHDIQAKLDDAGDDTQKEQAWRQYRGKQVRWIGELIRVVRIPDTANMPNSGNLEIVELGISIPIKELLSGDQVPGEERVVGVFSPGGWGIYRPKNLNINVGDNKPKLKPGGEGVFSPGGWGLVAVVFSAKEAEQITAEKASGLPTGKRQFRIGDGIVFEGRLSSAKGIPGGEIDPNPNLSSEQETEINQSHFGLTDGIILGGVDSFFDI